MDYTSLGETVSARLNRSDIEDYYPGFILQVEQEANSILALKPVRPMVKSYTLAASTQRLELPADFIDAIELSASDGTNSWPLARLAPKQDFAYYDNRALAPGQSFDSTIPQQYRILGDTLVLSITPESELTLTLVCYTKLDPVNADNATNWLMDNHADVYEFGVLAHAGKHLRDYDFYDRNRELFLGALEMVTKSYPERSRDIGLRDTGAPWATSRFSIVDG